MCKRVIALSLLLLLSFCSTSWAATYQITEEQLTTLEQNLNRLSEVNKTLTLNSDESKTELLKALSELKQLKAELKLSLTETTEARKDLKKANESLQNLNQSLKALEQQEKKLKRNNVFLQIVTVLAVGYAAIK